MIDLHLHTTYSDGKICLEDLLKMAESKNLDVISVTDHDTVGAYKELKQRPVLKKIFTGKIINGVELSLRFKGVDIHFLVYDYNYKKMEEFIKKHYATKEERNRYSEAVLLSKCKKANLKFDKKNINIDYANEYPIYKIYAELLRHEENKKIIPSEVWGDCSAFIYKYLKIPGSPFYVDVGNFIPAFEDVAQELKAQCQGKIFLAHPFNYEDKSYDILNLVLNTNILDGIECNHSNIGQPESIFLEQLCLDRGLLMSGGSDYHAKHEPIYMGLGTNMSKIENRYIENWVNMPKTKEVDNEKNTNSNK